ncbi:hypothetical protein UFOVP606_50 [uncultured Caudovirales phage]|uniref:2OGFeDO JBP1/TET oxygenase domain-containing protein n=1 Tax=uncultured Caudovirales phage TaxID=2100421 RepID=A0A6J5N5A2_9CAUD|nr:hypothetical protein UFOVP606_50 [uncultured Caudovirales phage]
MKRIDLVLVQHNVTIGDVCGHKEPNITEDSMFYFDGKPIGFYIKDLSINYPKAAALAQLANTELRSKNVPKSEMKRSSGLHDAKKEVLQYSTIIGSCPPKPHMRRPYASRSSVHDVPSAKKFIKAMLMLCLESEAIIKELTPDIYNQQKKIISDSTNEKWRFGNLFTSSISNYNICAPFHKDGGNLQGCVNVIIAKKHNATGGNTTVPDYNATMDSSDNSMLVYPAWRNVHGVTPIVPTAEGGYRNSLVFYPLKAFAGLK